MVKGSRRVVRGAGLVGLLVALTLVIAGAATSAQGYQGPASQVFQAGNPRCPAGTADAGSIKIDGSALVSGFNDGRISITRRGVVNGIDSVRLGSSSTRRVEVMAVIVKGGDGAYIYFYNTFSPLTDERFAPPLNGGTQAPQISHVEFCFDPKDGAEPELLGREVGERRVADHAQLGGRQAGQAGRRAGLGVRRQHRAEPARRRQRLCHVEGDGHALAGADVHRERHDHGLQRRRGRPSPASTSPTRSRVR